MSKDRIIINEFLTFVQNKIDILDELSIVQICATNFTDSEIETGKSLLFESLSGGNRNVSRKGDDKKKKNIKDVIKQFKETDPTEQPSFVAKDLNRLPPVSFDHVDVTQLLKDIAFLKTEMQNIRKDTATKTEMISLQTMISTELTDLRTGLTTRHRYNNNTKTSSSCKQTTEHKESDNNSMMTPKRPDATRICSNERPLSAPVAAVGPSHAKSGIRVYTPSYRDIIVNDLQSSNKQNESCTKDEDGYKLVVNKKRKLYNNQCGTAKGPTKIQVAELSSAVYISRIKKSTSADDIKQHITEMGESCSNVQLLSQHRETDFNSYKIVINRNKLPVFLSSDFWPEGIKYRRFRDYITRVDSRNNTS